MLPSALSALDFCYVTTIGRTTARPHRIEIWFAADPEQDRYGRVIEGTDEDEPARTLVHDKYAQGDDLAGWRATSLPVAIDLTRSAE